jgi:hypothetical protein
MGTLGFAMVLAVSSSGFLSSSPKLTGGTGTIYLGSYTKRMVVIDEATEKVTAQIPLTTGIPWTVHRSQDATRFYIQRSDQEHFEVVDIATRKSIDSFTQRGQPESAGAGLRGRSSTARHDADDATRDEAGRPVRDRRAEGFKYLRTITLKGDMPYGTFHVVAPRTPSRLPASAPR